LHDSGEKRLRVLLYVEQNYSFDILRPLAAEAKRRMHEVRWLIVGDADVDYLNPDEIALPDITDAVNWRPDIVFVPGDRIPGFISGLKVQVFHGLNEDKRGSVYPERGLFDLYCTEGPSRSAMLQPLATDRGYFRVAETGWPKLDTLLYAGRPEQSYGRPQILFGSTFTERLSGAEALYPVIRNLSQSGEWQWLITLHPKMAPETIAKYRELENENLSYFETDKVVELQHRADVMVSDNSSVLQEFLLLNKPVVTYRNRDPQPFLIDISEPAQLEDAVRRALDPSDELRQAVSSYGPSITPWLDGASASRVLDAAEQMLNAGWIDRKPANILRNLKMRRQLGYYGNLIN